MKLGIREPQVLKEKIQAKCASSDMLEMAEDVKSFLFNPKDVNKILLFADLITQAPLK